MGHLKNTRYINIPVYNVSMEDDILNLDTSIGITLVFPNIQDSGCMYADKRWYVNDATGGAAANPVTITAVSGIQINDATSQQLSTANFGACVFATNREKYIVTGSGSGGGGTTIVTSPFTPSNTSIVVGDDFQEVAEKSQGQINDIVTNVTTLQNNEYKITYFAEINAATGTITKPTGSTILLDQFAGGVDAYVSTITNGQPTGDFPETAGGVLVDVASFDASGNFVLSGTPSAYPCALIYVIKISAVDLSNALISNRLDLEDINIVKATQSTVDAGTNDDQFVTPKTLNDSAQLAAINTALALRSLTVLKTTTNSSHTGDTNNTKVYAGLIEANTNAIGDILTLNARGRKGGVVGASATFRIYFNTINDLSGATLIATVATSSSTQSWAGLYRTLFIRDATTTEVFGATTSSNDDLIVSAAAATNANIDWTVDQYLLFSVQLANGSDNARISGLLLQKA